MKFFDILNLTKDFICVPPCDWKYQESYLKCKNMLQKIGVVNDVAALLNKLIFQIVV